MILKQFTCRGDYVVFALNVRWGVVFETPNEYSSLVFGSVRNRISRNWGQAWSEAFNCCESTSWREFTFFEKPRRFSNWDSWANSLISDTEQEV
jgi:hypothetical protein